MSARWMWAVPVAVAFSIWGGGCLGFDEQLGKCLDSGACGLDLDGGPDGGPDAGWLAGTVILHNDPVGTVLVGECWPIHVTFRGPDGGTATAPFPTSLALSGGGAGVELYANNNCVPPQTGSIPLAAGATAADLYFRSSVSASLGFNLSVYGLPPVSVSAITRPNVQHGTCSLTTGTQGQHCSLNSPVKPGRSFLMFSATSPSTDPSVALASCHLSSNPTPGDAIYCKRFSPFPDAGVEISFQVVEHAKIAVYTGSGFCGGLAGQAVQLNGRPDAGSTFLLHSVTGSPGNMMSALLTTTLSTASDPAIVSLDSGVLCPPGGDINVQAVDISGLGTVTTETPVSLAQNVPGTNLPGRFPNGETPMLLYSYQATNPAPPVCAMMLRGWTEPLIGAVNFSRAYNNNTTCDDSDLPVIQYQLVRWPSTWSVTQVDFDLTAGQANDSRDAGLGVLAGRTFIIGGGQWANGTATGEGLETTLNAVGSMQGTFQLNGTQLTIARSPTGAVAKFSAQVVTLEP